MTTVSQSPPAAPAQPAADSLAKALLACDRIAPAWPLDQSIAVNPWWSLTDRGLDSLAPEFAAKSGARLVMPRAYFQQRWESGQISESSLLAAAAERGQTADLAALLAHLERPAAGARMALMTHVLDAHRDLDRHVAWADEVTHQISQLCAAYFDQGQANWHFDTSMSLYGKWLQTVAHDHGIGIVMGSPGLNRRFRELPGDAEACIPAALAALGVAPAAQADYLHALLLSLNGWASACAYRKWQAALQGGTDDSTVQLLAIRLAWEWVLLQVGEAQDLADQWPIAKAKWPSAIAAQRAENERDWVWQRALEIEYQRGLAAGLARVQPPTTPAAPLVQAAFCIDVRSEVYRRALESVADGVQTIGFAGFFGLPIAYEAAETAHRRIQLPGLLAPKLLVRDAAPGVSGQGQRRRLQDLWRQFKSAGTSTFSYVEIAGLFYGLKLAAESLTTDRAGGESLRLEPPPTQLYDVSGEQPLDVAAKAELAAGILRGMGLTRGVAPIVLLVGHGSVSANNPLASSLDCGACCGQSGEINARAVAAILNDPAVREHLVDHGIELPPATRFIAGLHNTTTDDVTLFNVGDAPAALQPQIDAATGWLAQASRLTRAERAAALQEAHPDAEALHGALVARSQDWSQVRPEWGLSRNAAFIVAPRSRTRGLDLQGRSFLHDYQWQDDPEFKLLELIMTAPMVVTHWINMQYYASTVDNHHYGSGNKVLHNVVGGDLGVFEGNGGDLRVGLSMQSLHDGTDWVHEPLRLSVVIEAPREAIAAVVAKHAKVRELVENDWLYLFQFDADHQRLHRCHAAEWTPLIPDPSQEIS